MKEVDSKNFLVDPDKVLEHMIGEMQSVVVVGVGNDGMIHVASSHGTPITNLLLDLGKKTIIELLEQPDQTVN